MNFPSLCRICLHPGSFEHKLVNSILPPIDSTSNNVDELWFVFRKILRIDDDEQRLLAYVCHTCHKEFRRIYAFVNLCEKNENILYQINETQILKDSNDAEAERLMIENNIEVIKTEETDYIPIDHEMEIKDEPLSPGFVNKILQELPEKDSSVDRESSIIESNKMQTLIDFHSEANRILRSENGRDIIKQQNGNSNYLKNVLSSHPNWPPEAELEKIVCKVQQSRRVKTILRKVPHNMFKCDLCSEKFLTKNRLTRHKRIIHGQINITYEGSRTPMFQCDLCSAKFVRTNRLTSHKKITHGHTYKCDLCSMTFSRSQHITEHKRQWHRDVSQPVLPLWFYNTKTGIQVALKGSTHSGRGPAASSRKLPADRQAQEQGCDRRWWVPE